MNLLDMLGVPEARVVVVVRNRNVYGLLRSKYGFNRHGVREYPNGSVLRVSVVERSMDVYNLAGLMMTNVLYDSRARYATEIIDYLGARIRSATFKGEMTCEPVDIDQLLQCNNDNHEP